jgi:hypothetical protein
MNQNNNYNIENEPLVNGESSDGWQKLKAYKLSRGTFYNGPYATERGNPSFGVLPNLGKQIFVLYALYYMISNNYKYSIYVILCHTIGCVLNGIRFYYVNALADEGEDARFLSFVVYDNVLGAIIGLIAILYILLKK